MKRSIWILALTTCVIVSCSKLLPQEPEANTVLAEPIADLTGSQMKKHILGDEDFAHIFSAADGLGPIFVQSSCENCHIADGKGNPMNNLTRFGKYNTDSTWNSLTEIGGPQLQHRSIQGYDPEKLPAGVQHSQFLAPNVTGLGYLAAVPDQTIMDLADPTDADGDGISGVYNEIEAPEWLTPDPRYHQALPNGKFIGRFGRKAAAIDLLMQTVGAYKQDMGVTSDFDTEDPINYATSQFGGDETVDPEVSATTVRNVVFYLQTLKQPDRRNLDNPNVVEGENIFKAIGCENCHRAELTTGPSEIISLNQVSFSAYTDMLLHDMGPELDDNYTEGIVKTSEWRTMPLWGLGLQEDSQGGAMFLLHDGRATSFESAIEFHGGEAAKSRENFRNLTATDKAKLIDFLSSL